MLRGPAFGDVDADALAVRLGGREKHLHDDARVGMRKNHRVILDERQKQRRDAFTAAGDRVVRELECGRDQVLLVRLEILCESGTYASRPVLRRDEAHEELEASRGWDGVRKAALELLRGSLDVFHELRGGLGLGRGDHLAQRKDRGDGVRQLAVIAQRAVEGVHDREGLGHRGQKVEAVCALDAVRGRRVAAGACFGIGRGHYARIPRAAQCTADACAVALPSDGLPEFRHVRPRVQGAGAGAAWELGA